MGYEKEMEVLSIFYTQSIYYRELFHKPGLFKEQNGDLVRKFTAWLWQKPGFKKGMLTRNEILFYTPFYKKKYIYVSHFKLYVFSNNNKKGYLKEKT